MKILIVEDEYITAAFIKQTLEGLGYLEVFIAQDALSSKEVVNSHNIDLIFMDINIKGSIDGLQLAREIKIKSDVKIIFITSYHDSQTIEEASLSTPVGYLIKPIIKSDIEAMMMIVSTKPQKQVQAKQHQSHFILLDSLRFDTQTKVVTVGDKVIKLSKLETKALEIFLQNLNGVISSDNLIEEIWGDNRSKSALRELISRLRKKIPKLNLQSYSSLGYILYSS